MKNQKSLGNKGFSLVELIVVIAIMAVLVGVLAPQFIKYVEKGRISTDIQNVEEIKTAIQTYAAENGFTTQTVNLLNEDDCKTENTFVGTALQDAGLSTTVTLKSSKWDSALITVTEDGVTVTGSAEYSGTTYTFSDGAGAGDE